MQWESVYSNQVILDEGIQISINIVEYILQLLTWNSLRMFLCVEYCRICLTITWNSLRMFIYMWNIWPCTLYFVNAVKCTCFGFHLFFTVCFLPQRLCRIGASTGPHGSSHAVPAADLPNIGPPRRNRVPWYLASWDGGYGAWNIANLGPTWETQVAKVEVFGAPGQMHWIVKQTWVQIWCCDVF